MADQRDGGIPWCSETWNPLRGCSVYSPGCRRCYAMRQAYRMAGPGMPYEGLVEMRNGLPVWTGVIRTVPEALLAPLRWTRPRLVFVNSMSDLFHEKVPREFIDCVVVVMAMSTRHVFQVLTKRSARMREYLTDPGVHERLRALAIGGQPPVPLPAPSIEALRNLSVEAFLPHVWWGASVEDQPHASRIDDVLAIPNAVGWISAEPLLTGLDLRRRGLSTAPGQAKLKWVVIGGESGLRPRRFAVEWVEDLIEQCQAADVPVFVKQLGRVPTLQEGTGSRDAWPASTRFVDTGRGYLRLMLRSRKAEDPQEWPEHLRVRQWPRGFAEQARAA